jgi:cation:H+ antiporter
LTNSVLQLLLALVIILVAAECFTNALENLGERLHLSEGVTGSVFAAVGTALPETVVPLLALASAVPGSPVNAEVATGSILGAPLMLSTLTVFLMTLAALPRRGLAAHVRPEHSGLVRDLNFFLAAFAVAAAGLLVPPDARTLRNALALLLVALYAIYLAFTMQASARLVQHGHGTQANERLWLARTGLPDHVLTLAVQLCGSLALLVAGAGLFIEHVEALAQVLGVSTLLLSLIVVPIATELPEKVNSILWIRRGKDTLAFGNITGAMVFQGTLLPALGLVATPWQASVEVQAGILLTLLAAAWLRLWARPGGAPLWALLCNGLAYLAYLVIALPR